MEDAFVHGGKNGRIGNGEGNERGKQGGRNGGWGGREGESCGGVTTHLGMRVKSRQSSVSVIFVPGTIKAAAKLLTSASSSTPQP